MLGIVLVKGRSMTPTLHNGERVLAWTPYFRRRFKRNVIVTLTNSHLQRSQHISIRKQHKETTALKKSVPELFIKRVIGVAGDLVCIPINQIPSDTLNVIDPKASHIGSEFVWQVPEDHVFVRGDGQKSVDSIIWGPIPISQLQHIILCRFPSFRKII